MPEPGTVIPGRWAHVRHAGHHLVVSDGPYAELIDPQSEPVAQLGEPHAFRSETVATACGRHFEPERIWHDPPRPHLKPCASCASATSASCRG